MTPRPHTPARPALCSTRGPGSKRKLPAGTRAAAVARALKRAWPRLDAPVKLLPRRGPFPVLLAAVLSPRTQDPVTAAAAGRLLAAAPDPARLARLGTARIRRLIYPVGFHNTKARALPRLARLLIERWHGRVPETLDELLELPGVGRKVANIVLANAFGRPVIAVDTHVHRVSNRLGLVRTKRPLDTELQLMKVVPPRFRRGWNEQLVALGQTICRPQRPRCPVCPVLCWCEQRGVRNPTVPARAARARRGTPADMLRGTGPSGAGP